jgi:hypothetical protein
MRSRPRHLALLLAALAGFSATFARADALKPASLLLFPEFDDQPGNATLFTITNVDDDRRNGAIDMHLVYVDASSCQRTDRLEHLTARDTVTFLTAFQTPGLARGYMYAYALDPITHKAIDFDFLIGSSWRMDGLNGGAYELDAIPFQALTGPGMPTDVNFNGKPDLDGIEYEKAHSQCFFPRFLGQFTPPVSQSMFSSDLILLQPLGNAGVTTSVGLLIYNDNEEGFSANFSFQCWTRVPVLSISGAFAETFLQATNQNPNEVEGLTFLESGWFDVQGLVASSPQGSTANPPILGVLADVRPMEAAELPFVDDP